MFKKVNRKVKSGDQFIELGKPNAVWEVVGIIDNPHLPPHVRIKKIGVDAIHLTSVSALLDKSFFRPNINQTRSSDALSLSEQQNDTHETI